MLIVLGVVLAVAGSWLHGWNRGFDHREQFEREIRRRMEDNRP